jgi:hypothetical protein
MTGVPKRKKVSWKDKRLYSLKNRQTVINQLARQVHFMEDDDNEVLATIERLKKMTPERFKMYIGMTPHCYRFLPRHRKQLDGLYAYREAETTEQKIDELVLELKVGANATTASELKSLESMWAVKYGSLEFSL